MSIDLLEPSSYRDLLKRCKQCEKLYGPGTRELYAFINSKYCSPQCAGMTQRNTIARLKAKIEIDPVTGCHNWIATKNQKGYGHVTWNMRTKMVHRLIWESIFGPIPEGHQLDHLCNNRACCNPDHLRMVTPRQNVLTSNNMAARSARQEVCPKCSGPYSVWPNGYRYCKPCRNAGNRAWYQENKVQVQADRKAKKLEKQEKSE